MIIDWDSLLSVGEEKIDRDHETLVGIVNKLDSAVNDNIGANVISE